MDELTRKRFDRSTSSKDWTPADVLKAALHDIETGAETPNRCLILLIKDDKTDGTMELAPYRSNLSRVEEIGYMKLHESIQLDRWRGKE